jgi:hypothetical protein
MIHLGYEKNLIEFIRKEWWRQGNTIDIAAKFKNNTRLLKAPVISAGHAFAFFFVLISALYLNLILTGIALCLWVLPSFFIVLKRRDRRAVTADLIQYWFLTWLRWNIAGLTIPGQLLLVIKRNAKSD